MVRLKCSYCGEGVFMEARLADGRMRMVITEVGCAHDHSALMRAVADAEMFATLATFTPEGPAN
jgi:hypothetical protein